MASVSKVSRVAVGVICAACSGAGAAVCAGQLPIAPQRSSGQSVTPAFEGWYRNDDGTHTLLVGYFNRNREQTLDIPVGPGNRIEPGGPDYGQPTHFLLQKNWGVFSITVPADFGDRKLTWTIASGTEVNAIPLSLHPNYAIEPFKDAATGNLPPTVRLPTGRSLSGPPVGTAAEYDARVREALTIRYAVHDDMHAEPGARRQPSPPTTFLSKFRGPGEVTFDNPRPPVEPDGAVAAVVRFADPGEYVIRIQVNDASGDGGGGFQCCWTNVHVKVLVRP